jgi:hypothetical protein
MIGEKIAEFTGKLTGRRVLPNAHGPKMEVCIEQQGKVLGVECFDYGTYESVLQDDGSLSGHGQGITMTKDGETVTWTANGVGRFTGKGQQVQWRGSCQYHTKSQKLAKLNGHSFVFEHDGDETGALCNSRIYEWK